MIIIRSVLLIVLLCIATVFSGKAAVHQVTNNADSGAGSLRDMVENVSAAGDTIYFLINSPITITSGVINVPHDVNVIGPAWGHLTISGGGTERIFQCVSAGIDLYVHGLRFENAGDHAIYLSTNSSLLAIYCEFTACASGFGGAIYNSDSQVDITHCSFSNNNATSRGGALYGTTNAVFDISNSTFVQNSAPNGGMIYANSGTNVNMVNVTAAFNSATNAGGAVQVVGSIFDIENCIIANNFGPAASPNVAGDLSSFGSNCIDDDTGITGALWPFGGDLQNVNPQFVAGGPDDYGRRMISLPIEVTSPCVDAGNNGAMGDPEDQRGVIRQLDGNLDGTIGIDMGAVEVSPFCVTNTDGAVGTPNSLPWVLNQIHGAAPLGAPPYYVCFNIAGVTTQTISPAVPMDAFVNGTTYVDGFTQRGSQPKAGLFDPTLNIEVEGSAITGSGSGFSVPAGGTNSVIKGLIINSFPEWGIRITAGQSVFVQGNFIGVDDSGNGPLPNLTGGIMIESNSSMCEIGGDEEWKGNVISGNQGVGLTISGSFDNIVERNYIGMDLTGLTQSANTTHGIYLTNAVNNTIGSAGQGNVISGNGSNGVFISNNSNQNELHDNIIGMDLYTTNSAPNSSYGISMSGSSYDNLIGGTAGEGNVISGNGSYGVYITASGGGNQLYSNHIGTDATGTIAFPNGSHGVFIISSGAGNEIGAPGLGNLISGHVANSSYGVYVGADSTLVRGNFIGTDVSGTTAMANQHGIYVTSNWNQIGGPNSGDGNLISGNAAYGINLWSGSNNLIQGNNCGLNANFNGVLANNVGIYCGTDNNMIGGIGANDANICSGNNFYGIQIDGGDYNTLHGNICGLDQLGTTMYGNQSTGVYLSNGAAFNTIGGDRSLGEGNVISGNGVYGVQVVSAGTDSTSIFGNLIGTDGSGTSARPNGMGLYLNVVSNVQIGDGTFNHRNVISGNTGDGIEIANSGTGIRIEGNYVGVDLNGNNVVANTGNGIEVRSSTTGPVVIDGTGHPNIVSGNGLTGIDLESDNNAVQGTLVGTNQVGATLPNSNGIVITGSGNLIGGVVAGEANTIAYNNADGIQIAAGTAFDNTLLQNVIIGNGTLNNDLGIDIGLNGVTANDNLDVDGGANDWQNFPVLNDATLCGSDLYVSGTLNSLANTDFYIEFFTTSPGFVDGSGYGEAELYVGQIIVTTDGAGDASFQTSFTGAFATGDFVTATATDFTGAAFTSTSEFAECKLIQPEISSIPYGSFNPTCAGGNDGMIFPMTFTGGVGPFTYAWSDGQTTDTAFNMSAGAYNQVITDVNGCAYNGTTVNLTNPPPITVSLNIQHEVCDGACDGYVVAAASGGVGPYTYEEVGGSVSPNDSILNLCDGSVTVRVTDNVGCTLDTTITINAGVVETANLTYSQNTWCVSDSAFSPATIGTGGGSFSVMPAAGLDINLTTGDIDPSNSVVQGYAITYTTPTCGLTNNFIININDEDDASFFYPQASICQAAANPLPNITGLSGGSFTAQAGLVINSSTGEIDLINSTAATTLQVWYTTAGQCPNTDTFVVYIVPLPDASFQNPVTSACAADAPFNMTVTNPGGTFSGGAITDANLGTFDPSQGSIGLNEVVHEIDNGSGCIDSDTIYVEIFDHPTVTISGGGSYCSGDQPPSIDVSFGGQTSNSTFDVYVDGNYSQTVNVSSNPQTINPGNGTITIENVVSVDGCASLNPSNSIDIIEIQPAPAPTTNYTDTTFCVGGTIEPITATNSNGGNIIWFSDAGLTNQVGTGSPFTPTLNVGVNSFFVIEEVNGCAGASTEVTINYINILAPSTSIFIDYCPGDSIAPLIATANSGGIITWYSDAALTNVLGTGTTLALSQGLTGSHLYYVTESVGDCESSSVQVNVLIYDGAFVGAGNDQSLCPGDSVQLQGFGGASYSWTPVSNLSDPTAATPFASPDTTTTYVLTITNPNGCVFVDSMTVTVLPATDCGMHVFNAFTPDDDGVNDNWLIEGLVDHLDNEVFIFNRWGDQLIRFQGYNNADVVWNGTNDVGENLPTGTYYYVIKLNDIEESYSGWVYLER